MEYLFVIWLFISLFGSFLMIIDKQHAIHHKKRISEKTLILTAALGAASFMWITMYLIHHKTRHIKFTAGLPLLMVLHGLLLFIGLR
ncbi:MAG: DUF1294 domain-containing protein [Erysipelotrichaceae bacterium]|nr:DUF1294 domain-containing protein [Erysipelotrichaceae bacterium]